MLIFSMAPGERVQFLLPDGQEIWVSLQRRGRLFPRLAIDAPDSVRVHRERTLYRYGLHPDYQRHAE